MKKWMICLCLLMKVGHAQLYVENGGLVYVNDTYITVTNEVHIGNNGNIFLRNEGQLLQTNSNSNTGTGQLSVFQEGRAGNFHFNYWCSPVGLNNSATGNSAFGISMLRRPIDATNSQNVEVTTGVNGVTNSNLLRISSAWINKFVANNGFSSWQLVGNNTNIQPGEGFTMKGVSGIDPTIPITGMTPNNPGNAQRYDFRGRPNNGDIQINVSNGGFTLIGNPYPSAINLRWFLVGNSDFGIPGNPNCNGVAYFWEQDLSVQSHNLTAYRGGYGTFAGGSGVYTPATFFAFNGAGTQLPGATGTGGNYNRTILPIGQGFMIRGVTNGTVTMRNLYRVFAKESLGQSVFAKNNTLPETQGKNGQKISIPNIANAPLNDQLIQPSPHIKINTLLNNQAVKPTAIVLDPTTTAGYDSGFDAITPAASSIDMYFKLDSQELIHFAIPFDVNVQIPIAFRCNQTANFKIQVDEMVGLDQNIPVYLWHIPSNQYYDIKNQLYSFDLSSGVYENEFKITFTNQTLGNNTLEIQNLIAYTNQQTLFVKTAGEILENIEVYDIQGRIIQTFTNIQSNQFEKPLNIPTQVIILKIKTTEGKIATRKLVI